MTLLRHTFWTVLMVSLGLEAGGQVRPVEKMTDTGNSGFERIVDDYLAEFYGVGREGRAPGDGSAAYYGRRLDTARQLLERLQAVDRGTLSFDQDIDYRYLEGLLKTAVMDGDRVKRWQQDPRLYLGIEPIISTRGGLLHQESRPLTERAARILELMRVIPTRLENARKNLTAFIPLWLEPSRAVLEGNVEIFEQDVPRFAERVPAERAALLAENAKVLAALRDFGSFLSHEWPARPPGDWRIGKEVFDFRIRHEHLIDDLDSESFYRWGRQEHEEQLHVLERTAAVVDPTRSWRQIELDLQAEHPSAESMIYEHLKAVRRNRPWLVERDLVSIPWDPENAAIAAAAPAVYGKQQWYGFGGAPVGRNVAAPGGWSLVPVDPRWSPERREEFLRGHNWAMINTMVAHEVYPGHGLVQLYLNHNPRKLRVYASSYANQAWCYYVEWVLAPEHGFYPAEKQGEYRVEMERNKLWRYARVIYDAGMHTGKVSFEEARQLMSSGVLFAERFAFIEVEQTTRGGSGTSIPTWGYHQILALRDEYFARMAALGRKGTLKDFHDRLLKIGMLPVKLIRETLLRELEQEGAPKPTESAP